MRTASAALRTLLDSKVPLGSADLFTFALRTGGYLRWNNTDSDITFDTELFSGKKGVLKRTTWNMVKTMEVPTLTLSMGIGEGSPYEVSGVNLKTFAYNLGFDGASVRVERIFWAAAGPWGDTNNGTGSVILFTGPIGAIDVDGYSVQMKAQGANIIFNQTFPRNLYQILCQHTLYNTGCTLSKAAFTFSGTVTSASRVAIEIASPPTTLTNCVLGTILFTSGVNQGITRTIKAADADTVIVSYPLTAAPTGGDTFDISWGCDRAQATCSSKFNNLANFKGFPYVPDAALAY